MDLKIGTVDSKLEHLTSRVANLEDETRGIKLQLENEVVPRIRLLAENYVPAAHRYEEASNEIGAMKSDISLLKICVSQHSEMLGMV